MTRVQENHEHPIIKGFDEFKPALKKLNKKALLCYLVQPAADYMAGQKSNRFSNSGLAVAWPKALNQLGYAVDIVGWDDKDFTAQADYDLVIFHGGQNFQKIFPSLKNQPPIIHYSAGSYWRFNNQAEDERIKDFQTRHKVKLPRDRYLKDSEDEINEAARGIIVIGNEVTRQTYSKYPLVIDINLANFPDDHFNKVKKDYAAAKDNWLFFAGGGNIHKGLDLVIDAFMNLSQHLYVITPPDKEFMAFYKSAFERQNIHWVGEQPMRNQEFYETVDKCAFQIFPSCSEGQAGSVTEAMNQGVIPVVSKQTGLDPDECGLILQENTIECIDKAVRKMSALDSKAVERLAKRTRKIALTRHNPQKFDKDLRAAIKKILD